MPLTPSRHVVAAIVAAVALVPAGAIAVAQASSTHTIKLKGEQFSPRSVTIHKGDRVAFKWSGGTHNLLQGSKTLVSPRSSGTKTITFHKTGTFTFTCTLHANMTTKVKVR